MAYYFIVKTPRHSNEEGKSKPITNYITFTAVNVLIFPVQITNPLSTLSFKCNPIQTMACTQNTAPSHPLPTQDRVRTNHQYRGTLLIQNTFKIEIKSHSLYPHPFPSIPIHSLHSIPSHSITDPVAQRLVSCSLSISVDGALSISTSLSLSFSKSTTALSSSS